MLASQMAKVGVGQGMAQNASTFALGGGRQTAGDRATPGIRVPPGEWQYWAMRKAQAAALQGRHFPAGGKCGSDGGRRHRV